jgi:hypothetical protein
MKNYFPLTPTSGTLHDDQIVGREKEINNILKSLTVQSVTIEEMRRMGKTLLLKKLVYLCNSGNISEEFKKENFNAIYFSLQGQKSLGEVIDTLIRGFKDFKKWYQIDLANTGNFIGKLISGVKIDVYGAEFSVDVPEFQKSWKKIFFETLKNVSENLEKDNKKLILILDELPIMLWDWYQAGRHQEAIELLDILRERRQDLESKGLRFVYCGSIGIKVILQTLKSKLNYTGEPTNDMREYHLKPFSLEDSKFLMECFLLSGFEIENENKENLFFHIHNLCNGLPFYISNLFHIINVDFEAEITKENIDKAFDSLLNETHYQKIFNQLKERLEIYYKEDSKGMIKILNILSKSADTISESQIITQTDEEVDAIKNALETLVNDHYLVKSMIDGERNYTYKYLIFKEWWRLNKA